MADYDELDEPGEESSTPLTTAESVAKACLRPGNAADLAQLQEFLAQRGIAGAVVEQAVAAGSLGLNLYISRKERGQAGYCGPAAAFAVRTPSTGDVVAVDMVYFKPEDNGGVTGQTQGERSGHAWASDWRRLASARTVYVVDSPVAALAIESCGLPGAFVVATRGIEGVRAVDWSMLRGRQVIGCFPNDLPDGRGYCPGLSAFWTLHEVLTALDISCLMVDQAGWLDDDDAPVFTVQELLTLRGVEETAKALRKLQDWLIPGMVGDDKRQGKPRLFLPHHDYMTYWRYRCQEDFTKVIGKTTKDDDGNEKHEYADVCGFRIAAVSRVRIASDEATMTGNADNAPSTMFALSVQVARHGPVLQRVVVEDDRLHNIEVWKRLGPVYAPTPFSRMVNVWERAASIGARDAINFVGLAWRDGRLAVNEGTDCFFTEPTEQCPYYNLTFPSSDAVGMEMTRLRVEVFSAFAGTFADNEATIPLIWALGAHLKAFLGYWPHFVIQAEKGAGKSALVKSLGAAVAMKQFSRQTLQSEYRIIGSVSYTSQPVAWGEFSTNKQELRTKAVGTLQECYQYESTSRGIGLKRKFLMSAPVLLSGEDVPVDGLEGKIIRTSLTKAKRGPVVPEDLPPFPVRQWLQFLAKQSKKEVLALHARQVQELQSGSLARADDAGAERMVNNYAALATAWYMLCEFAQWHPQMSNFLRDLTRQMNAHIADTKATRHPWVWIIEKLLSEIARGEFRYPFKFDNEDEIEVLCIRTGHIMDHMSQSNGLRAFWDELPIKSDRALKKQLALAGVLMLDGEGEPLAVERTVHGRRVAHMVAISLPMLRQYGLHAVVPVERGEA